MMTICHIGFTKCHFWYQVGRANAQYYQILSKSVKSCGIIVFNCF